MADPSEDDVPIHESLHRIIHMTRTSLETISSFGGGDYSGIEFIRTIIEDG